jgi:hypothetical protein
MPPARNDNVAAMGGGDELLDDDPLDVDEAEEDELLEVELELELEADELDELDRLAELDDPPPLGGGELLPLPPPPHAVSADRQTRATAFASNR